MCDPLFQHWVLSMCPLFPVSQKENCVREDVSCHELGGKQKDWVIWSLSDTVSTKSPNREGTHSVGNLVFDCHLVFLSSCLVVSLQTALSFESLGVFPVHSCSSHVLCVSRADDKVPEVQSTPMLVVCPSARVLAASQRFKVQIPRFVIKNIRKNLN